MAQASFKVIRKTPAAPKAPVTPVVEEGDYGPTITLNPGAKYAFRFGLTKAQLITEHYQAIQDFVAAYAKDGKNSNGNGKE